MTLKKKISDLLVGKEPQTKSVKVSRRRELYPEERKYNNSYPMTKKVSIFEAEKPNKLLRVVDPTLRTVGEKPYVDFATLIAYKNMTPQIDTIIGFETDMIVGTDININADDDEAKKECERLAIDISLYDKMRNHTNISLSTGFGLVARIAGKGGLQNIEEFDIATITEAYRDEFGNILSYRIDLGNGQWQDLKNDPSYLQIVFKRNGRSAFGLSEYNALAVRRTVNNRTTRPLIEAFWSLDDVVTGTLENFAYPVEYHVYEGANQDDLELEAKKLKDMKPGDRFVISRPHTIDRREPTQARFDAFIGHYKDLLQHGTGFPIDMLTGDFTSRASSQTADTFFMRKIKSYQKYLLKLIKKDILEYHLMLLGWNEERIKKANISIAFEADLQEAYTPQDVLSRVSAGLWSKEEGREYDKSNGQDLFDDDLIKQQDEQKQQMELDVHKKSMEAPKPLPFKKNESIVKRAEEIKDKIFSEKVEKAITERLTLEAEKIRESIEEVKLSKKSKEALIKITEDITRHE